MKFDWNINKYLKDINITFIHYDKFENLIIIIEKLIKHCENSSNVRDKIYKIYFNS